MEFIIVKTKNVDSWRIRINQYNFKEDWIIFATILGFEDPIEFVKYIYDTYESSNITREFYIDDTTKQFSGVSGFDIWFSVKKDADNFMKELNEKLGAGQ